MVKVAEMRTAEAVLAHELEDPELQARWEATALARLVANRLVAYRADHGLSQSALARLLGMKQPAVARLETGEHNPSLETLARISAALGIEFAIAFSTRKDHRLSDPLARAAKVKKRASVAGSTMLVVAS
jgi:DNA-binding XRE family transcriptional regulator